MSKFTYIGTVTRRLPVDILIESDVMLPEAEIIRRIREKAVTDKLHYDLDWNTLVWRGIHPSKRFVYGL
jgi:hypothetical protein